MSDRVLVVAREILEKVGLRQGFSANVMPIWNAIFQEDNPFFMDRRKAETSPEFKQIIPYVVLGYWNNKKGKTEYFIYQRGTKGGEKRLIKKMSFGLGGHINPEDSEQATENYEEIYKTALLREIEEEVLINASTIKGEVVGIINDDSNLVGKVHLGIVHYWDLSAPDVKSNEEHIQNTRFVSYDELLKCYDSLETWSQYCLEYFVKDIPRMRWDEVFMTMACVYALRSPDPATKHGCIIVDSNNVPIGLGYNGFPKGGQDDSIYSLSRPDKYLTIAHSELNALLNRSLNTQGGTVYVTGVPCSTCMIAMIQGGIKRVVYGKVGAHCVGEKEWNAVQLMARNCNIQLEEYSSSSRSPFDVLSLTQDYLLLKGWRNKNEEKEI